MSRGSSEQFGIDHYNPASHLPLSLAHEDVIGVHLIAILSTAIKLLLPLYHLLHSSSDNCEQDLGIFLDFSAAVPKSSSSIFLQILRRELCVVFDRLVSISLQTLLQHSIYPNRRALSLGSGSRSRQDGRSDKDIYTGGLQGAFF